MCGLRILEGYVGGKKLWIAQGPEGIISVSFGNDWKEFGYSSLGGFEAQKKEVLNWIYERIPVGSLP